MDETVILGISPFKPMQQTPSVMSLGGQLPHSDVDRGSLFLDNTFFEQPQEMFMLKNI